MLKVDRLLFLGIAQNEGYFWEVEKISIIFWVKKKSADFFCLFSEN